MSALETAVFDLGNVLLMFDWQIAADRLCAGTGKSRREVDHYFMTTPFAVRLDRGEMSRQEFFETVGGDMGFDGTYEEFALIWSDIFSPNEPMIALARRLRGRVRRFVLSNTNAIHMDFIFERFPFIREFEGHVFSHEVGAMKPEARIYEFLLKRFTVEAGRAVFIDDIRANVEGARVAGLHGIHYQDPDQVRQELTELGIPSI
jgi:putative hydrolase of the HAD superfamily